METRSRSKSKKAGGPVYGFVNAATLNDARLARREERWDAFRGDLSLAKRFITIPPVKSVKREQALVAYRAGFLDGERVEVMDEIRAMRGFSRDHMPRARPVYAPGLGGGARGRYPRVTGTVIPSIAGLSVRARTDAHRVNPKRIINRGNLGGGYGKIWGGEMGDPLRQAALSAGARVKRGFKRDRAFSNRQWPFSKKRDYRTSYGVE